MARKLVVNMTDDELLEERLAIKEEIARREGLVYVKDQLLKLLDEHDVTIEEVLNA